MRYDLADDRGVRAGAGICGLLELSVTHDREIAEELPATRL